MRELNRIGNLQMSFEALLLRKSKNDFNQTRHGQRRIVNARDA